MTSTQTTQVGEPHKVVGTGVCCVPRRCRHFLTRARLIHSLRGTHSHDTPAHAAVDAGELLMKEVYEAIRASPVWNETLFLITYDEHGVSAPCSRPRRGVVVLRGTALQHV